MVLRAGCPRRGGTGLLSRGAAPELEIRGRFAGARSPDRGPLGRRMVVMPTPPTRSSIAAVVPPICGRKVLIARRVGPLGDRDLGGEPRQALACRACSAQRRNSVESSQMVTGPSFT